MLGVTKMLKKKQRAVNCFWIFVVLVLMSCASADRGYVYDGVQKFLDETIKENLAFSEIQQHFSSLKPGLELFNNCSNAFEEPVTPCDLGYTSMVVFPASAVMNLRRTSDDGDVQVSLTFDASLVLKNHFYEIYFGGEHI
jgi:hypothetical protein